MEHEKTIICFGDSLVFGYGAGREERWVTLLDRQGSARFLNRGKCHEPTDGLLARLPHDVLSRRPDGVILMSGSNDLFSGLGADHAMNGLAAVCTALSAEGIPVLLSTVTPYVFPFDPPYWNAFVDFPSVLPQREALNKKIRAFAGNGKDTVRLLDLDLLFGSYGDDALRALYLDEIHYSAAGHRVIADHISDRQDLV